MGWLTRFEPSGNQARFERYRFKKFWQDAIPDRNNSRNFVSQKNKKKFEQISHQFRSIVPWIPESHFILTVKIFKTSNFETLFTKRNQSQSLDRSEIEWSWKGPIRSSWSFIGTGGTGDVRKHNCNHKIPYNLKHKQWHLDRIYFWYSLRRSSHSLFLCTRLWSEFWNMD